MLLAKLIKVAESYYTVTAFYLPSCCRMSFICQEVCKGVCCQCAVEKVATYKVVAWKVSTVKAATEDAAAKKEAAEMGVVKPDGRKPKLCCSHQY